MQVRCINMYLINKSRGVARGGPESPQNLADQLTLFEPGWADFAPHTTASPLGFKKLSTPLLYNARSATAEMTKAV